MSHSQVPQGRGGFPGMQWSQAVGLGGLIASPEFFCPQSTWEGTGRGSCLHPAVKPVSCHS